MKRIYEYEVEDTSAVELQASEEGLRRYVGSRFGMSVHWGLYTLSVSGGEWIYLTDLIPYETYKKRMERFNPVRFSADEWCDLMLEAGMKFLLITSKHHDGFCLWDTEETDFKVTNTAFRRDILAELSEALRARGLGLHFYYSLPDWTHPAYRTNWPEYVEFYQRQVRELCTNFGEIGGMLFDGYCPSFEWEGDEEEYFKPRGEFDLAGTYDMVHTLQPDAVITNNTAILPLKGEDYQVWEDDVPGENNLGHGIPETRDRPTACWWNLNSGWSYQPWNHRVKSVHEIMETYHKVRAKNAVLMLNVGPRSFGDIHPEEQQVIREVGRKIAELEGDDTV